MTKTNQYEAMFLMGTQYTADVEGALKLVRSLIEKHGGNILVAKKWDERKLAYEIGKAKRGLYIISYFTAPGGAIAPLERDVKLSEDFLRVLVTTADHLSIEEMQAVEPQPIAPPQPERAPWDMPQNDRPDRSDRGPRGPRGPRRDEAEAAVGKE
jgi:small subunit ribosomal protein S6